MRGSGFLSRVNVLPEVGIRHDGGEGRKWRLVFATSKICTSTLLEQLDHLLVGV